MTKLLLTKQIKQVDKKNILTVFPTSKAFNAPLRIRGQRDGSHCV